MYKVIIVDDDKIIRKDIVNIIDWEKMDLELVGEAYDGKDALIKIRQLVPDIVISDICMPHIDGVKLIEIVKLKYPNIKFIMLSNYDDFKFVKAALKNGAIDYMLKYEVNNDNLCVMLATVKRSLDEEQKNKEYHNIFNDIKIKNNIEKINSMWESLLESQLNYDQMYNKLLEYKIDIFPTHCICLAFKFNYTNTIISFYNIINLVKDIYEKNNTTVNVYGFNFISGELCIFINFKEAISYSVILSNLIDKVQTIIKLLKLEKCSYNACISEIFTNIKDLSKSVLRCKYMLRSIYYNTQSVLLTPQTFVDFCQKINIENYNVNIKKSINSLLDKDLVRAIQYIDELVIKICKDNIDPQIVNEIYDYFINELNVAIKIDKVGVITYYSNNIIPMNLLEECKNIGEIKCKIEEIFKNIDADLYIKDINLNNKEINKAVNYIIRNYSKNIGLQEVAQYIGISKNHFCRLFKQQIGENYLDYLNKVRIQHCKNMLISTELNIEEISENAGFHESRYFRQVFFKYTGLFPSEYRRVQNNK